MELLPADLRASLPPLYSQEHNPNPRVHLKFFTPDSDWTWFVTEGQPQDDDFISSASCVALRKSGDISCFRNSPASAEGGICRSSEIFTSIRTVPRGHCPLPQGAQAVMREMTDRWLRSTKWWSGSESEAETKKLATQILKLQQYRKNRAIRAHCFILPGSVPREPPITSTVNREHRYCHRYR
jgi:hypothetical protein